MGEVGAHRGRIMKSVGIGKGIDQEIEVAEPRAQRLVQQRSVGRPDWGGHAGTAIELAGGSAAIVRLADLGAIRRIGDDDIVGYRAHGRCRQPVLVARLAEEPAYSESALAGCRTRAGPVPPGFTTIGEAVS